LPILRTTAATFREHLEELGIQRGDRICVHSRLISFGYFETGVEGILNALLDAIGPRGTIAVPTFTLNIRENDIFNPATTPPNRVGALSDHIWYRGDSVRSTCPVHSYAALGLDASLMHETNPCQSLGPESTFDIMQRKGFSLLLLGCTYTEGATFVHHVEAEVGVPYREWLDLPRQIQFGNDPVQNITVRYYARARHLDGTNDLTSIESAAQNQQAGKIVPIPKSPRQSHLLNLNVLSSIVSDVIKHEPYSLFRPSQAAG